MEPMNIIALSDCHLRSTTPIARKDNIFKTQFKKLKFIFDYAQEHDCIILQAGDFLDKSRDWAMLVSLIDFLGKYPDVRMYCVLGQHDKYFYSQTKATTLGVLEHMNLLRILDHKVPFGLGPFNVFGSSWGDPLPEPSHPKDNILVTHRPICDNRIYPGQEYTRSKKFLKSNKKYKLIVVGDIHRAFFHRIKNDHAIVNTGPMLRNEANEYNMQEHKPHFWHFQTMGTGYLSKLQLQGQKIPIPHKSSDEVLTKSHIPKDHDPDLDIDGITSLLGKAIDSTGNKIIFDNLFKNKDIRPKIRKHLQEIYDNAKG